MNIAAIPTVYNGIEFRSRLEAKWAAFFDMVGWKWEYEPIDLNGYIPDFVIAGSRHPIYVEIKPSLDATELQNDCQKARLATPGRRLLMLGGTIEYEKKHVYVYDDSEYGVLREMRTETWNGFQCVRINNCDEDYADLWIDVFGKGNPNTEEWNHEDPSTEHCIIGHVLEMGIERCGKCMGYSPTSYGYQHCIICGSDPVPLNLSPKMLGQWRRDERDSIHDFWKKAANTVQYRHKSR